MKHMIYFNAYKYKVNSGTPTAINQLFSMFGCHHNTTDNIFINIHMIINTYHPILSKLPSFDDRFNVVVSHEIIHRILANLFSDKISVSFDDLTLKYWHKNIDISTNYDLNEFY